MREYHTEAFSKFSQREFQELVESLPLVVWTAQPDGRIDYISPQWEEVRGLNPAHEDYLNWLSILHPDEVEGSIADWERSLKTGEVFDREQRYLGTDGVYRWRHGRAVPIRNDAGEIIKWYGTSTDIHEQKMVQDKILNASEEKDHFIAMLSHELRNPLGAISNAYEIITSKDAKPEQQQLFSQVLGQQLEHLKRLVDDTLDVSRLTSGKFQLISHKIDMRQLVQDSFASVTPELERGQKAHDLVVPSEPVWVEGDSVRLQQCIINLINNAIKFTNPKDEISVSLTSKNQEVTIEVSDNGIGMEPETMEQVFQPFHQGDNATEQNKQGLGLGLAVIKQLVEMHGGKVRARSEGSNMGSQFQITLPTVVAPEPAADRPTQKGEDRASTLSLLLIEDNESLSASLKILIEIEGHQVHIEEDGISALKHLETHSPDMIISDLTLPGAMNGWQIAERISQSRSRDQMPYMVALSGHAQPKDIQKSLDSGFHKHLAKPIEIDDLKACLNTASFFQREKSL